MGLRTILGMGALCASLTGCTAPQMSTQTHQSSLTAQVLQPATPPAKTRTGKDAAQALADASKDTMHDITDTGKDAMYAVVDTIGLSTESWKNEAIELSGGYSYIQRRSGSLSDTSGYCHAYSHRDYFICTFYVCKQDTAKDASDAYTIYAVTRRFGALSDEKEYCRDLFYPREQDTLNQESPFLELFQNSVFWNPLEKDYRGRSRLNPEHLKHLYRLTELLRLDTVGVGGANGASSAKEMTTPGSRRWWFP